MAEDIDRRFECYCHRTNRLLLKIRHMSLTTSIKNKDQSGMLDGIHDLIAALNGSGLFWSLICTGNIFHNLAEM